MKAKEKILTDEQINNAWGNADFGNMNKRDVISGALLKCASSYYTGHTAKCIVEELGLVTKKWTLTKIGKEYLFAHFSDGMSV